MTSASTTRARVGVLGLGSWGSALALHCARMGHTVTAWHREGQRIQEIQKTRKTKISGKDVAIPDSIGVTHQLSDLARCDYTIVALPSSAWSAVLPSLQASILISATKGLEKSSRLTPLSYCEQTLRRDPATLCVISGPSFASDLVAETPISLTAGSAREETAQAVAKMLSSTSLRVYTSLDPHGVEWGGILKNIIAIAVGISDALEFGPSTRAALISRGLAEMIRVATHLGADSRTLSGLSGLGDLIMTATDDQSRNRMVGLRLGRGEALNTILSSIGATAEGVNSAPLVAKIAADKGIEAPIIEHVVKVLEGALAPRDLAVSLMSRPLKSEF